MQHRRRGSVLFCSFTHIEHTAEFYFRQGLGEDLECALTYREPYLFRYVCAAQISRRAIYSSGTALEKCANQIQRSKE